MNKETLAKIVGYPLLIAGGVLATNYAVTGQALFSPTQVIGDFVQARTTPAHTQYTNEQEKTRQLESDLRHTETSAIMHAYADTHRGEATVETHRDRITNLLRVRGYKPAQEQVDAFLTEMVGFDAGKLEDTKFSLYNARDGKGPEEPADPTPVVDPAASTPAAADPATAPAYLFTSINDVIVAAEKAAKENDIIFTDDPAVYEQAQKDGKKAIYKDNLSALESALHITQISLQDYVLGHSGELSVGHPIMAEHLSNLGLFFSTYQDLQQHDALKPIAEALMTYLDNGPSESMDFLGVTEPLYLNIDTNVDTFEMALGDVDAFNAAALLYFETEVVPQYKLLNPGVVPDPAADPASTGTPTDPTTTDPTTATPTDPVTPTAPATYTFTSFDNVVVRLSQVAGEAGITLAQGPEYWAKKGAGADVVDTTHLTGLQAALKSDFSRVQDYLRQPTPETGRDAALSNAEVVGHLWKIQRELAKYDDLKPLAAAMVTYLQGDVEETERLFGDVSPLFLDIDFTAATYGEAITAYPNPGDLDAKVLEYLDNIVKPAYNTLKGARDARAERQQKIARARAAYNFDSFDDLTAQLGKVAGTEGVAITSDINDYNQRMNNGESVLSGSMLVKVQSNVLGLRGDLIQYFNSPASLRDASVVNMVRRNSDVLHLLYDLYQGAEGNDKVAPLVGAFIDYLRQGPTETKGTFGDASPFFLDIDFTAPTWAEAKKKFDGSTGKLREAIKDHYTKNIIAPLQKGVDERAARAAKAHEDTLKAAAERAAEPGFADLVTRINTAAQTAGITVTSDMAEYAQLGTVGTPVMDARFLAAISTRLSSGLPHVQGHLGNDATHTQAAAMANNVFLGNLFQAYKNLQQHNALKPLAADLLEYVRNGPKETRDILGDQSPFFIDIDFDAATAGEAVKRFATSEALNAAILQYYETKVKPEFELLKPPPLPGATR